LAIADLVFARHQHITADDIYDQLKPVASVSRATVYNTLALFSAQGLVREIKVDSARTFFDSNTQPHQHFFNVDTGELTDFELPLFPQPSQEQLPEGTQLESMDVIIRIRNMPSNGTHQAL
jgi:Fur family iron response transcriptional regulator